jgi:hypothetical protein
MASVRHDEYMRKRGLDEYGNHGENNPPVGVDLINHPPHYNQGDIECIDAIASCLGPEGFNAYCRGNIIKYNWRSNHKGGVQDIEKARWYLEKLIEKERQR